MRRSVVAGSVFAGLLALSLGCIDADSEPVATGSTEQPILGGTAIARGQFPTVVAVVVGQGSLCTGTMVAPDLIVTAAHCVSPDVLGFASQESVTQQTNVVFDATDIYNGGGKLVRAAETIAHPDFTRPGQPDIGLVRLAERVTDRTPTPINLDPNAAPIGVEVTIVGYGLNELGNAGEGFFIKGQQSTSCAEYGVSDGMFLCFDQQAGLGKCSGDSGGPSFGKVGDVDALVGITSFGDQNCEYFGADFRVDAARPFLEQHAPELFCIADAICDETCGTGGKAADPDCAPACVTDTDCGDDSVCNAKEGVCEPAPFTPGGIGAQCGNGMPECASGLCATGSEGSFCTSICTTDAECPDGFECADAGNGTGACWVKSSGGGCQTGSGSSAPFGMIVLLGAVAFLARRRRA